MSGVLGRLFNHFRQSSCLLDWLVLAYSPQAYPDPLYWQELQAVYMLYYVEAFTEIQLFNIKGFEDCEKDAISRPHEM